MSAIRICFEDLSASRCSITSKLGGPCKHFGGAQRWAATELAGATTLRTSTLALVHSTAMYCAPVWCRSAHTRLIDPAINDALRIVTGYLRPTPADNLPILAGIQPAELRCSGATLSLARHAMEPGHLLHSALTRPSSADARRLKSRHPFVPAALQLIISSDNNIRSGISSMECGVGGQPYKTAHFHPRHRHLSPGATLPRAWVRLNCVRTGLGRFRFCLYKWGMASSTGYQCDVEQTVDHIVLQCPIHRPPHGLHGLTVLDETNRMAAQHLPRDLVRPSSG